MSKVSSFFSEIASLNSQGYVTYTEHETVSYLWWYHLIGLIWTSEFIIACEQLVICGAVAKWYFNRYVTVGIGLAFNTLRTDRMKILALLLENRSSGFLTRSDTNRALQSLNMARGLKFRIQEVKGLYYPCSENKGADQLRGYREADLCLCFCIYKNPVFS